LGADCGLGEAGKDKCSAAVVLLCFLNLSVIVESLLDILSNGVDDDDDDESMVLLLLSVQFNNDGAETTHEIRRFRLQTCARVLSIRELGR
jgi:hypothetical protein